MNGLEYQILTERGLKDEAFKQNQEADRQIVQLKNDLESCKQKKEADDRTIVQMKKDMDKMNEDRKQREEADNRRIVEMKPCVSKIQLLSTSHNAGDKMVAGECKAVLHFR